MMIKGAVLTFVETQVATAMFRAQNAEARSAPEREKLLNRVLIILSQQGERERRKKEEERRN